jgi:hypothetical protein
VAFRLFAVAHFGDEFRGDFHPVDEVGKFGVLRLADNAVTNAVFLSGEDVKNIPLFVRLWGTGHDRRKKVGVKLDCQLDEVVDHAVKEDVERCNKRAKEDHGNQYDESGTPEFAEFFKTFHLGIAFPGPGGLLKFALNFGDELRNLAKHASRWGDVFGKKWQVRRDSNPQLLVLETNALPIELLTCWCLFFRGK